jgi:Tfp pilus assembly protein PilF
LYGRAVSLLTSGQIDRAIAAADTYLARDSTNPTGYWLRGQALLTKGNADKAISDFDRAIELKAGYADALTGRGLAWLKKSDYNRALADPNRAIEADGTKVLTYTARASVYEAQGKTDLASMDLRKAAALPPKSAFDTLAQAEAKRRVERLTKQIPCGGGARTGASETCL